MVACSLFLSMEAKSLILSMEKNSWKQAEIDCFSMVASKQYFDFAFPFSREANKHNVIVFPLKQPYFAFLL